MKKEILKKLREAREHIKNNKATKKDGNNDYGKYDYYTPELVEKIVTEAEIATGTITICNFKQDELGLYQELIFSEIENPESSITFTYRTKHGKITATNETQQMGGTDTYSERYIKMKVFNIKDNTLDPDAKGKLTDGEKEAIILLEKHEMEVSMIDSIDDLSKYYNDNKNNTGLPIKDFNLLVTKRKNKLEKKND